MDERQLTSLVVVIFVGMGCASDKSAEANGESENKSVVPPITSTKKDGKLIKRFDVNEDGRAEIEKVFELVSPSDGDSDGRNSDGNTMQREILREKRIDVNEDGTYDLVRFYNKQREKVRERVDIDRDGTDDWVSYFDEGTIARKKMLADDGESVTSTRYYDGEGELERVEMDRNDDGKIDYWEYYESGRITRIGRDVDGDEKADSFDRRQKKTAAGLQGPELGGESGQGQGNSDNESKPEGNGGDQTSQDDS